MLRIQLIVCYTHDMLFKMCFPVIFAKILVYLFDAFLLVMIVFARKRVDLKVSEIFEQNYSMAYIT